jgi:hypothetical protein
MFGIYFNDKGFISTDRVQKQFDRNEYYRVDVYISYKELVREFVSGSINIDDWHTIEYPTTPMN